MPGEMHRKSIRTGAITHRPESKVSLPTPIGCPTSAVGARAVDRKTIATLHNVLSLCTHEWLGRRGGSQGLTEIALSAVPVASGERRIQEVTFFAVSCAVRALPVSIPGSIAGFCGVHIRAILTTRNAHFTRTHVAVSSTIARRASNECAHCTLSAR